MRLAVLRSAFAAVLWTWLLLGSRPVLAREPTGQEPASWAYISLATGPLERVEGCFEELGVPLPRFLRREFLEDSFAMIGPGGLRGTSSLGVLLGPSDPGATKPDGVLLFPVNRGAAPLKELISRGGRPVADSSDTVRVKGSFFRRTQGFLLFGTREEYITQADPLALEERLSAPGLLADMDVDFERWRKTDPASFYSILKKRKDTDDDGSHLQALGRGLGLRIFDRLLDRVRVTLFDNDDSLRMRFVLDPLAPGEILPLPRPAFPRTVLGRVDIAYSSAESSRWVEGVTEELMDAAEKDNLFIDAERARLNVDQVRAVMKETVELFWSADAVSISLEPVKGRLVYHQVNQYRGPSHFTKRVAAVVKKLEALDRQAGTGRASVGFTSYSAGGARVSRLTFPGKKRYTIDFVDSGSSVRIVGSSSNQRRLPALLKLPAEGSLTSGFSGAFDPSAAVDAYLASGGHMALPLRMRANVRGQLITWTTRAEGSAAAVDFDVPKPLAQAFLQLLGTRAVDLEAEDSNP